MTAALTPPIALAYLRELSTDVRAAVVLDAAGERLAGDAAIVPAARALLALAGDELVVRSAAGVALARRDATRAIVVAAGPQTLVPLLLHDLRTLLGDLGDAPAGSVGPRWTESVVVPDSAVRAARALLDAAAADGGFPANT